MDNDPRANRHYKTSPLPTLMEAVPTASRQEVLFALYREVCSSWRMLTDVRFKLLGFVPVTSGIILLNLLSNKADGPSVLARVGIVLFGLLITLGLLVYDIRNSELYDDLISRGRKIEEELGIDTGQFLGRREPKYAHIKHGNATKLLYGTAIAGWLVAGLIIGIGL